MRKGTIGPALTTYITISVGIFFLTLCLIVYIKAGGVMKQSTVDIFCGMQLSIRRMVATITGQTIGSLLTSLSPGCGSLEIYNGTADEVAEKIKQHIQRCWDLSRSNPAGEMICTYALVVKIVNDDAHVDECRVTQKLVEIPNTDQVTEWGEEIEPGNHKCEGCVYQYNCQMNAPGADTIKWGWKDGKTIPPDKLFPLRMYYDNGKIIVNQQERAHETLEDLAQMVGLG
jgi:hypothetical protein